MRAAAIRRRFVGVGTYSVGTSKYPWAGCEFYTRNSNFDSSTTSYADRQVGQVGVALVIGQRITARQ